MSLQSTNLIPLSLILSLRERILEYIPSPLRGSSSGASVGQGRDVYVQEFASLFSINKPAEDNSQTGFASAVLIVLLTMGVIAGVWLTQTGTNFFPNASEQEGLNPSAGRTKNCDNEADKDSCITENNAICERDTVTYCDNRSGSPRAIRKSGGYYEPGNAHADPASGCVFDYREVPEKNSECAKSESKSGDVVYTTKDEAKKLDEDRESTRAERERQSGGGGANIVDPICTDTTTEQVMKDEKVTGNLVRYYSILAGQPNYCTPADLGVEPKKEAQSTSGKTGRLMLCSKSDASLTWRVLVDSKLEASSKGDPTKEQAESEMSQNVESALNVASPTQAAPAQPPAPAGGGFPGSNCLGGVCP